MQPQLYAAAGGTVSGRRPHAAPFDGPYTVDEMRLAVRIASEEGADAIKTYLHRDPESSPGCSRTPSFR